MYSTRESWIGRDWRYLELSFSGRKPATHGLHSPTIRYESSVRVGGSAYFSSLSTRVGLARAVPSHLPGCADRIHFIPRQPHPILSIALAFLVCSHNWKISDSLP